MEEKKKLPICEGCIREDNHPKHLSHYPIQMTPGEAITHAQKCPKDKCIYDPPTP